MLPWPCFNRFSINLLLDQLDILALLQPSKARRVPPRGRREAAPLNPSRFNIYCPICTCILCQELYKYGTVRVFWSSIQEELILKQD